MHPRWLAIAITLSVAPVELAAATHCRDGEIVVFSCQIKGSQKVASLCSSVRKSETSVVPEALFYRFGKLGNVELEFPPSASGSLEKFSFNHYFRPGLDSTAISFTNGTFNYSIYETLDNEDSTSPDEQHLAGLSVSSDRKNKGAGLTCSRKSIESNWAAIDGAIPCKEDGPPNTCDYRPQ